MDWRNMAALRSWALIPHKRNIALLLASHPYAADRGIVPWGFQPVKPSLFSFSHREMAVVRVDFNA
jgi:hypothetical protein